MKRVAASEHDLLTVARALVGQLGPEAVEPLLRRPRPLPRGIGPTAAGLLRALLSRGVVLALCRRGGWQEQEQLDSAGEPQRGRLWRRHPAPALRFGPPTLAFLRWVVEQPLGGSDVTPFVLPKGSTLELGDELLLYLGCDLLRRAGCAAELGAGAGLRASSLVWLGAPELLALHGAAAEDEAALAGFDRWLVGSGSAVLEGLQPDLAARWADLERHKARIREPARLLALGQTQARILTALSRRAAAAGRRDLMRFVLEALAVVLAPRPEAQRWVAALATQGSLGERQAAARASGALCEGLEVLHRWASEARTVRFFDDDYAAAQLLLRQWELLGPDAHEHARSVVRELGSLALVAGEAQTG